MPALDAPVTACPRTTALTGYTVAAETLHALGALSFDDYSFTLERLLDNGDDGVLRSAQCGVDRDQNIDGPKFTQRCRCCKWRDASRRVLNGGQPAVRAGIMQYGSSTHIFPDPIFEEIEVQQSRTLRSTPESRQRAGYDGAKRKRGSKVHMAVDTLGHLLALNVTPANVDDRVEVGRLADAIE